MKRLEISGTADEHLSENETRQLEDGLRILARIIARAVLKERSLMATKYDDYRDSAAYPYRATAVGRPDEPLTLSVAATAKILGLSRNSVYDAIRTGQIPSLRFGKRIVVPRAALNKMLLQTDTYKAENR